MRGATGNADAGLPVALRLVGTALAAAILGITLAVTLSIDADDIRVHSVPDEVSGRSFTVDLDQLAGGDRTELELRLSTRSVAALATHDAVELLVATFDPRPQLREARLLIAGTECAYSASPSSRLRNNQPLILERGPRCRDMSQASGELRLTVELASAARVAVWSQTADREGGSEDAIFLGRTVPTAAEDRPQLRIRAIDYLPETGLRRIDLLAYMWQLGWPSWWIWIAVAASSVCFGLGACALLSLCGQGSSIRASLLAAVAGFGLAFGLSLAYAVIVPPFQAADEPSHFVAYGAVVGRDGLHGDATHWARVGHFERLQFRPAERFRPSDAKTLGRVWDDDNPPNSTLRGQAVEWIWSTFTPNVTAVETPQLFIALRLLNVTSFAACVGFLFFVMHRASGVSRPTLLVLPLMFIPALPFFGMHLSNHALLLCAYLFAAAGALLLVLDSRSAHYAGLLIGLGWSAGLLTSRAAAPLFPFIALLFTGRLLLGDPAGRRWTAPVFWLGAAIPVSGAIAIASRDYLDGLLAGLAEHLPAGLASTAVLATLAWSLIPAALILALLEIALTAAKRRLSWRPAGHVVAGVARVAAGLLLLLCAGALVMPYPILQPLAPGQSPDPRSYVIDVVAAGLTMFRFAGPDRLTSYTFWGGFGWLEFGPPAWLVTALAGATGVSLAALLLWIARTACLRALLWLGVSLAGFTASLAAYAWVVATATPADFHGRYVLGLYVWLLLICWTSLPRWMALLPRVAIWRWIPAACACAIGVVHAISLAVIVRRYLG